MTELIEYRVRPVTRYIVTRFESGTVCGDMVLVDRSTEHGHFSDERMQFAQRG